MTIVSLRKKQKIMSDAVCGVRMQTCGAFHQVASRLKEVIRFFDVRMQWLS
jgi:hypothetical protein